MKSEYGGNDEGRVELGKKCIKCLGNYKTKLTFWDKLIKIRSLYFVTEGVIETRSWLLRLGI